MSRVILRGRPELFASPWFVVSVLALVVNDWVLKPAFHNAFTGKLSDFAGLLALTLFACAISERFRWWSAGVISVSFVYWKSPHSQLLISYLNEILPLGVGRTPDYTDLLALPVVWIAAFYGPRLRPPAAGAWTRYSLAGLSVVALAATSYVPHYAIRESGDIGVALRASAEQASEHLERVVDRIAAGHGLSCKVCDPLSEGRLYTSSRTSLSLLARLDQANSQILYEARSSDVGRGQSGSQEVDAVRAQLVEELRKSFPSISIAGARLPSQHAVSLGVSKRNSFTSYRDPQNHGDIQIAKRVVADATKSFGLKRYESSDVYYLGALLGWPPYAREFVVHVGVADDPLVSITIARSSDRFADLQRAVAEDLERRLKEEFGAARAGKRCWIFSC